MNSMSTSCRKCSAQMSVDSESCPNCGCQNSLRVSNKLNDESKMVLHRRKPKLESQPWVAKVAIGIPLIILASLTAYFGNDYYRIHAPEWEREKEVARQAQAKIDHDAAVEEKRKADEAALAASKAEKKRHLEELNDEMKSLRSQESSIIESLKTAPMSFTNLRRFTDSNQSGVYEGVHNGVRKVVLIADPGRVQTNEYGIKSYYGPANSLGEKPYVTNGGITEYNDTFEMSGSYTRDDLDKVQNNIRSLKLQMQNP